MPQNSQIIPEYRHPHVMTVINDNTEFQETSLPVDEPVRALAVFTSSKGRDGVVLNHTNEAAWVEEYGKPNFAQFGQPGYNAYNTLSTRVAKVWSMRVMPDDASYSNLVLVAKVKVDATDPANKKLVVRFEAVHHTAVTDKNEFEDLTHLLRDENPDVDGFETYPLFVIYNLGRGAYGNNHRVRLVSALQADKDSDYKNYRLEVYELEGTLNPKGTPLTGTFVPDSLEGNVSVFLEDVINDTDTGSSKVNMKFVYESLLTIFNKYKTDVDPLTTATLETFDIMAGKDKVTGTALKGIQFDTSHADYAAMDDPAGLPLEGGNDGTLTYDPLDKVKLAAREDKINELYGKAFRGEFERSVLSKRRTPCEFILDAGYADEVKKDLVALFTQRTDAKGYLDAGIINTVAEAVAWGEQMKPLGDRLYSKEIHHYKTRDPFSGKMIPVTITFFLATALPLHLKNVGNHIPFVGEDYAKLLGAAKGTLRPLIDADDSVAKEQLYDLRLNYFQSIDENTYVRGTQSTSQNIWSDLSEDNNMFVLLEIKRKVENMVSRLSYDFAEAEERARFKDDADRLIAPYRGIKLRSAEVDFGMNAWEEERSILHCYLSIVFRTINKRGIVEIDINKRVSVS